VNFQRACEKSQMLALASPNHANCGSHRRSPKNTAPRTDSAFSETVREQADIDQIANPKRENGEKQDIAYTGVSELF
jgi:hypothetical protein